jgi:transcriptional regulator with XRE-family HTH domain
MAQQAPAAGREVARVNGTTPHVPVAAGRKGFKAELDDLRERMRGLGLGFAEIADEVARRYRVRPREAYRLAYGWTREHAAARFNALAAHEGTDPQARATLTGPRLCEYEKWPSSERKPLVYVLLMLAQMYETDVLCLLDLADHEHLAPQHRLVLLRRPRAETPFGEKLVALMEARELSLREVARRVPCSPPHVSHIIHGHKSASERMAGRLDDVLNAGGELAALAEMPARNEQRATPGIPRGYAPDLPSATPRGIVLSLPYVPGRLVIEVSDPAGNAGRLAAEAGYPDARNGQLSLVQGLPHSGQG